MAHDCERRRRCWRLSAARGAALIIAPVAALTVSFGGGWAGPAASAVAPGDRMAVMRAAAREFGVPVRLLLAISYNQTRWERLGDSPSADGGYGLMDLTAKTFPAPADWRGLAARPLPRTVTLARTHDTLDEAARLLHLPTATLKTSERQNVRGAAALLARYARHLAGGALPASLGGWYGAVADYSGATTVQAARLFAGDVFRTLATGASLTTADRQVMDLPATPGLRPDRAGLSRLGLGPAPRAASSTAVDCPADLNCTFVPAAYARDNPHDPGNYGNYDTARRPAGMRDPAGQTVSMKIKYIIVHDTEGSYDSAINTFQNPASYVSANYVIRSADGAVTEMVRPHDVSWGAGDWYVNMHAINIENEGFAAQGAAWYTQPMYGSCAALVRYLAARYGILLDRAHILGHEDVPGPTTSLTAAQHWDPGPFWDWNHFMALVHGVSDTTERAKGGSASRGRHQLVTIDPAFDANEPPVSDCPGGTGCVPLPSQPASFVYLHTGPGETYPLIGDPVLHPGGGHGTTVDSDWGDKATIGETFVLAGQSGKWTAIWFAGQRAWFYNPPGAQQKALYRSGKVITPKAGLESIPVYGAAYPEASAYPPAVPATTIARLAYTIHAGQEYPTAGAVPADFYYAVTINSSRPDDHTVIIGRSVYDQISFNHRRFFVRARDVTMRSLS
ncbi:MAG TPA: N-acetylmuramoyl-L-alanine amidase [Actinobacteria bacterium]|nr:N-acetylmuramoyl-L-alanine amidase [Actinomycetota bacterium]